MPSASALHVIPSVAAPFEANSAQKSCISYRGLVYPWHCDHMGHMNVMWYTGKFDEASWSYLSLLGIDTRYLRSNDRRMAAVKQTIAYMKELFAGDAVTITTTLHEIGRKTLHMTHEMRRNDEPDVAATSELIGVHLDATTRRGCEFPEALVERMRAIVNGGGDLIQPAGSQAQ